MSIEAQGCHQTVEFRLLGPLDVRIGGTAHRLGGARQEKLLTTLLLDSDHLVTTAKLIDLLWEENPPDTARRQVHNAIALLRRNLGPAGTLIFTEGPGYGIRAAEAYVDVRRFGQEVDDARRQMTAGNRTAAIQTLSTALELWRGPAMAGLGGQSIEIAAARLNEQRLAAQELRLDLRLEESEAADLLPELTKLVAENPLRESLRYKLILALYRCGRQSEALSVYEEIRVLLAEELGADPAPDLRALHGQILRNDGEAGPAAVPHSTSAGPVAGRSPATGAQRHSLPYDVVDFAGRAAEIDHLLAPADARGNTAVVITSLDGMPGIGKTTLAIRVAHLLSGEYPDGQLFIDLHGHTPGQQPLDAATALDLLLRSIGVPPELVPQGLEARADRWRAELAHKRFLVVLDNAENDVQIRPLLPGTGDFRVLITSRRRLSALEGVASFSLDLLPRRDAVALFQRVAGTDRTEGHPEQVDVVVELCGFLPLAIRIAASRFRHRPAWTVAYLAERLRDERRRLAELAAGDKSVMAAFTISYRHLSPSQQRAFRLLGLHPGEDFDEYGLAALMDVSVTAAADLLEDLLDVHLLIQHTMNRYHFHDLLRQHARTMAELEEPKEERHAAWRRLAEHYLNLGLASEHLIDPGRQSTGVDLEYRSALPDLRTAADVKVLIATEHRNLSALIGAAGANGLLRQAWQLPIVIGPLLLGQGYTDEALASYGQGLEAARASGSPEAEATLCRSLGLAYIGVGRFHDALRTLREGLSIEESRGNAHGIARMLANIGIVHIRLGQYGEALTHLLRSMELLREIGTPRDKAALLGNLGVVHTYLGRYTEAAEYHLSALALNTDLGNRYLEVSGLVNVGWTYTRAGRLDIAPGYLQRALTLSRQIGSTEDEGRALFLYADCLRQLGRHTEALEQCRKGLVLARTIHSKDIQSHALNVLGLIHLDMGHLEMAKECFNGALQLTEESGQSFKKAVTHDGLGRVAAAQGDHVSALGHWEKALTIAVEVGMPLAEEIRRRISATSSGDHTAPPVKYPEADSSPA